MKDALTPKGGRKHVHIPLSPARNAEISKDLPTVPLGMTTASGTRRTELPRLISALRMPAA
jgi:hypothetical protein